MNPRLRWTCCTSTACCSWHVTGRASRAWGGVAVLHDLNLALRYSDRCVVLQGGQLVASGVTAEVLTPACIHQVWGVRARPVPRGEQVQVLQYVFEPGQEEAAHRADVLPASLSLRA